MPPGIVNGAASVHPSGDRWLTRRSVGMCHGCEKLCEKHRTAYAVNFGFRGSVTERKKIVPEEVVVVVGGVSIRFVSSFVER